MHRFKARIIFFLRTYLCIVSRKGRGGGGGGAEVEEEEEEEPGCSITSTGIAQRHVEKQTAGAFRPGDRTESTVTCEQLVSLKRYHPLLCENTTNSDKAFNNNNNL